MNKDKQRIAIAEACGHKDLDWRIIAEGTGLDCLDLCSGIVGHGGHTVPYYLNDLNAMHAAEGTLAEVEDGEYDYTKQLKRTLEHNYTWKATAAQRAEAFLRTIGKWEES